MLKSKISASSHCHQKFQYVLKQEIWVDTQIIWDTVSTNNPFFCFVSATSLKRWKRISWDFVVMMNILCRKTIFNYLTFNMELLNEWDSIFYIFSWVQSDVDNESPNVSKMWQLFIDYLYPIITNFRLWFSVRLPITNAWHLAIIMCSTFKQCLRLGYLYIFLHFIFANNSHIVRLRPLIFSFVTHPYALPLVPSISIGLKIMLTRYKIHRR